MENLNEIKKLLYREKPIATKNKELSTDKEFIYEVNLKGLTYLHHEKIVFVVPVSDMGEKQFNDVEGGQLLIRWITEII